MANKGINFKIRLVENGYTIHITNVDGKGEERHRVFVTENENNLKEIVNSELEDEFE